MKGRAGRGTWYDEYCLNKKNPHISSVVYSSFCFLWQMAHEKINLWTRSNPPQCPLFSSFIVFLYSHVALLIYLNLCWYSIGKPGIFFFSSFLLKITKDCAICLDNSFKEIFLNQIPHSKFSEESFHDTRFHCKVSLSQDYLSNWMLKAACCSALQWYMCV
jgi:hypothetical protein